jgi:hypothetical protein
MRGYPQNKRIGVKTPGRKAKNALCQAWKPRRRKPSGDGGAPKKAKGVNYDN